LKRLIWSSLIEFIKTNQFYQQCKTVKASLHNPLIAAPGILITAIMHRFTNQLTGQTRLVPSFFYSCLAPRKKDKQTTEFAFQLETSTLLITNPTNKQRN
jgi:hypothetical protein